MRFPVRSRLICLCMGLSMAGCTSTFEPRMLPGTLESPRLPDAKSVQGGVEVALEEYYSSHKARRAFDADVGASGVIPILVSIENKSGQNYRLRRELMNAAIDGTRLANIYALNAAETAALRNPAWNALINTAAIGPLAMFFGIGTMAASANQTQKINRQIEQHFERMELTDRVIKANETATGFVFFGLTPRSGALKSVECEIVLEEEPVEGRPAKVLVHRLVIPRLAGRPQDPGTGTNMEN